MGYSKKDVRDITFKGVGRGELKRVRLSGFLELFKAERMEF